MFTLSFSYETALFALMGVVALLVIICAVALYNDYRAGVFFDEENAPCIVCGEPSGALFCYDCHVQTALDLARIECKQCLINEEPCDACSCEYC